MNGQNSKFLPKLSLYKNVVLADVPFSIKFFLGKLQTNITFLGEGGKEGGIIWLWAAYIHI